MVVKRFVDETRNNVNKGQLHCLHHLCAGTSKIGDASKYGHERCLGRHGQYDLSISQEKLK